jgi:TonB family protein
VVATALLSFGYRTEVRPAAIAVPQPSVDNEDVRQFIFIVPEPMSGGGGGGGGGGNRQTGPIRRAEGVGHDPITLRVGKPVTVAAEREAVDTLPQLLLNAKPLASGNVELMGLPNGGVTFGTSTGPGTGGGVGDGSGTGIGSGEGSGIGPGSGGGIGGGVYLPGGQVTAPRVIVEVNPVYSSEALVRRIQGTVALEFVVRADGRPADIRVVRSLDPGGLDTQAIAAASQWRFDPGRLNGQPVDVLVTLLIDFWIR